MCEFEYIKKVCVDLISKEKRKTVFEILDFYYDKSKTISDFDVVGELSLKAEYRDLYLKCAEQAYFHAKTSEQLYNARTNLYKAYNALNYPEKALFYVDMNDKIKPNDFDTQMNRAFNLALSNRREEAEKIIESLISSDDDQKENLEYALSGKMLRNGDTAKGILNFIDTFKPKNTLFEDALKMKKWTGGIQPGKTIYINGEGGIGDEIINIRFLDNLKKYGMNPILYSSWNMYRPDLVHVFRRHGYDVICNYFEIDKRNAVWTNMMPLPGYLDLSEEDLWTGQYLFPLRDPKNKIQNNKFKIGIKCSGNPYFSQDAYRCIPIEEILAHLPKNDNVEIYYFDKEKSHPSCVNMNNMINTWEDTLDYLDQMDVIVSSCTSIVHAAGAMNKKTIVIVPIAEYYTWTSTRKDNTTPWYDRETFKVFKQEKVRSWKEPLEKMQKLVESML